MIVLTWVSRTGEEMARTSFSHAALLLARYIIFTYKIGLRQ